MSDEPFIDPNANPEKEVAESYGGAMPEPDASAGPFDGFGDAVRTGAGKAKQAAKDAAPSIKTAVGKAAYAVSFGAAYGGSFGLTLIKELVPKPLKSGGADGFGAGKNAAEKVMTPREKDRNGKVVDVEASYSVS